jgi:hypothetical protein
MSVVPAHLMSEREQWALRIAPLPMTPPERLEFLDFLNYPEPMPPTPADRTEAVVLRILGARAKGEHVS